jgi:hypothetical protein
VRAMLRTTSMDGAAYTRIVFTVEGQLWLNSSYAEPDIIYKPSFGLRVSLF